MEKIQKMEHLIMLAKSYREGELKDLGISKKIIR